MKLHLLITCVVAAMLVACGAKTNAEGGETAGKDSLQTDSVVAEQQEEELQIETIVFKDSAKIAKEYTLYEVKLRIPAAGTVVGDSIRKYICRLLNNGVTMDVRKAYGKAAKRYFAEQRKEVEEEEYAGELTWGLETEVTIDTITPHYVSLCFTGYDYRGGAHGMPWSYGVTFAREDGHALVWKDFFADKEKVRPFISKYLDPEILETVSEYCNLPGGSDPPVSGFDPWLHGDTVVINYSSYEIGPYVIGMPSANIPANKLRKLLKQRVLSLIED